MYTCALVCICVSVKKRVLDNLGEATRDSQLSTPSPIYPIPPIQHGTSSTIFGEGSIVIMI